MFNENLQDKLYPGIEVQYESVDYSINLSLTNSLCSTNICKNPCSL